MEVEEMKYISKKNVSIALSMLLFATTLPVADAININEGKLNNKTYTSSTKFFMIGIIRLDWEIVLDIPIIYGFWPILVLCLEFQNEKIVNYHLLRPQNYIDFNDFICNGVMGPFTIRAILTEK